MEEAVLTKAQARKKHREEMAKQGIKLGCRKPSSAKAKNRLKYPPEGKCLVCGMRRDVCLCDNRSAFVKARAG